MAGSRGSLQFVIDDLRDFTARKSVGLALELHAELTESTPIDTGWARSNWQMVVGAPASGVVGSPENPGSPPMVTSYKLGQGPINITNNVPYIQRLNDGWSQQAPAGYVEAAIDRAIAQYGGRRR